MSFPVQPGRMDLLLLALAEHACKRYIDPALPMPVWSEGVAREIAARITAAGIPNVPISHIRVGQLNIPLPVAQWIGQVVGILPKQIGGLE